MAFMTQLLPEVSTKVLEKNPTSMAQSSEFAAEAAEAQRLLRDKTRPLGNSGTKPWVLAIQEGVNIDSFSLVWH